MTNITQSLSTKLDKLTESPLRSMRPAEQKQYLEELLGKDIKELQTKSLEARNLHRYEIVNWDKSNFQHRNMASFAALLKTLPIKYQSQIKDYINDKQIDYDQIEQIHVAEEQPIALKLSAGKGMVFPDKYAKLSHQEILEVNKNLRLDNKSDRGSILINNTGGFLHRISQFFSGALNMISANQLNRKASNRNHSQNLVPAGFILRVSKDVVKPRINLENKLIGKLRDGSKLVIAGAPGSGKTTLLRNVLSVIGSGDEENPAKMVVAVEKDTSNELFGDSKKTPLGVYRYSIKNNGRYKETFEQTVEKAIKNSGLDILAIDEINTAEEAEIAASFANRGPGFVASTHKVSITDMLNDPNTHVFFGNVDVATLGDKTAAKHGNKVAYHAESLSPIHSLLIIGKDRKAYFYDDYRLAVNDLIQGKNPIAEIYDFETDTVTRGINPEERPEQFSQGGVFSSINKVDLHKIKEYREIEDEKVKEKIRNIISSESIADEYLITIQGKNSLDYSDVQILGVIANISDRYYPESPVYTNLRDFARKMTTPDNTRKSNLNSRRAKDEIEFDKVMSSQHHAQTFLSRIFKKTGGLSQIDKAVLRRIQKRSQRDDYPTDEVYTKLKDFNVAGNNR